MTQINAKIVADSKSPQGHRITTFLLTYPRMIHSELMTHRLFSRNSASSRAIPFEKMATKVEEDPFIPLAWQRNHKGMQGNEYETEWIDIKNCEAQWLQARNDAVKNARFLNMDRDITKQLCNRLLEPFMWHTVLVTATEYDNFFNLRCPQYQNTKYLGDDAPLFKSKKDYLNHYEEELTVDLITWLKRNKSQAEIHIQALAEKMWDAYNSDYNSLTYEKQKELIVEFHQNITDNEIDGLYEYIENHHPTNLNLTTVERDFTAGDGFEQWLIDQGYHTSKELKEGEWHIPFGDKIPFEYVNSNGQNQEIGDEDKIKIAIARAARLSYANHDGEIDYEKDIKLHDRLLERKHMSCFEHTAKAMNSEEYHTFIKGKISEPGNQIDDESFGWCANLRGFIPYRYMVENTYNS